MSYSIKRSSRNRDLFVVARSDGMESKAEFKFKEAPAKYKNKSKIKSWVKTVTQPKRKVISKAQYEQYQAQVQQPIPETDDIPFDHADNNPPF